MLLFPYQLKEDRDTERIQAVFRKIIQETITPSVFSSSPSKYFNPELPDFIKNLPDIPKYPDKPEPDVSQLYDLIIGKYEPTKFQKLRETPEYISLINQAHASAWSFHPWFPKDRTYIDEIYSMIRDDTAVNRFITQGVLPARVPPPYGKPITLYFDSRILIYDMNLRDNALMFFERAALRWEVVVWYKDVSLSDSIDSLITTS